MLLTILTFLSAPCVSYGQDSSSVAYKITSFPNRFFNKINRKVSRLDTAIDRQTDRYIRKLMRQEAQLREKFTRLDSNAAKSLFLSNPEQRYAAYLQRLHSDSLTGTRLPGQYLPYADSLQGSLGFVKQTGGAQSGQAGAALSQLQGLEGRLNTDEQIRQYILERKEQIKQYLSLQQVVPKDIQNLYGQYNVQLYYYSQQLQAYKDMLDDPDKMMTTALKVLDKIPAFNAFMHSNSFLSSIAPVPDDYNMANSIAGMQTRDMVNQLIQNQVAAGGPNAASALSQNLQSAQAQLDQLKNKLNTLGPGSGDADLPPGFQANTQKTKTFLQRLVYGMNMQTLQSNHFFPVTNDIALTLGYKLNDKNIVGIGVSYKIGWGQDIEHIRITSQGVGLRSSLDTKIKGSWYASGGLEYNYQEPFNSLSILRHLNSWQQSGLIGVSKIVSIHTKYFRQVKLQALWDFLSYQQIPQAQPLKFRVGYNF
jgi:hypothetical protein